MLVSVYIKEAVAAEIFCIHAFNVNDYLSSFVFRAKKRVIKLCNSIVFEIVSITGYWMGSKWKVGKWFEIPYYEAKR